MLTAAMFVAVGQLFWKISEAQINFWLIIGFFTYGIGALIMTVALRFGKLSMLQPIFSFSYIAAIFFGNIFKMIWKNKTFENFINNFHKELL